ncbi:MAG TPA: hypothetical protein VFQ61_22375 [Polyangiaceae bacterium]|nr:hypothetical protein [Polyangiaceae bacterium]
MANTPGIHTSDFHIGRYRLAKHFATSAINALDVDPKYARQLLLESASEFPSGRVPLFVCECCADLSCGAITVAVEIADGLVTWRDFGRETPYASVPAFPEIYARTGPFYFELTAYRSTLRPYSHTR